MSAIWTMLAAMVLCMLACTAIGYVVGRRVGYSAAVVIAGLAAAAMLLFGRYMADSVWVARIVPMRILPVFGNWMPLMAGVLAGTGWAISRRPPWIRALVLGSLLVAAMLLPYQWLFEEHPRVRNVWMGNLCLQTTDATCGAAAAATLLRSAGIDATEHEMVDLCFTTWRGTPLHGVVYGLSKKTEGTPWRVRVAQMDQESLMRLGRPVLLRVGLETGAPPDIRYVTQWGWVPGVAHMVVMTKARPDGRINIADPASGWESWDRDALNVLWQGIAIYLEPRTPEPAPVFAAR